MTTRDNLKQALDSIICASIRRDRPGAAEEVVKAMEAHFQSARIKEVNVLTKHGDPLRCLFNVTIDPHLPPYYCRADGINGVKIAPEHEFLFDKIVNLMVPPEKDPDVADLLLALSVYRKYETDTPTIYYKPARERLDAAWEKVRAKYE